MSKRNTWSREELLLAYNLYCKLPYGNFNVASKAVQHLAKLIGRTPGAVAFKLVNFVNLDPKQRALGRKGASNVSHLDRLVFDEFANNFDETFLESENLLAERENGIVHSSTEYLQYEAGKTGIDVVREVKVRQNQDLFRTIVLSNYASQCAVTGINVPEVLIASHIKPWSEDQENRLNPRNGICLSATFDKLFDRGLMTFDNDYRVVYSQSFKSYSAEKFYGEEFDKFENKIIKLPVKFLPGTDFLAYHREHVFVG